MNNHNINDFVILVVSGLNILLAKINEMNFTDVMSVVISVLSVVYIAMGIFLRFKKIKKK